MRVWLLGAALAALTCLGANCLFTSSNLPTQNAADVEIPAEANDQLHVPIGQRVTYAHNPPASGPHWSGGTLTPFTRAPAPDVFYPNNSADIVLPEQWVHNLEHGHVVILYDCKGNCAAELTQQLSALINQVPPSKFGTAKLLITPYDGLPSQITAVAWHVQMQLEQFDEQALVGFYNRHVDRGPEDIP